MEYTVTADFYISEFNIQLSTGDVIRDGDLEPDVIAQLFSQGTLVSDALPVVEAEEKPKRKH